MNASSTTLVIWNPSAGSVGEWALLRRELAGHPHWEIVDSQGRDDAIRLVREAADNGVAEIIAAGGDGTVSAVLDGYRTATRLPLPTLGVLPLGSGNDLARGLQMPLDPAAAVQALETARVREIDVIEVDGPGVRPRWFANMATGGNTGRYLEHLTPDVKRQWGPLVYLRGVLDVVADLRVFDVTITCDDGRPETFEALNVFLANGPTSGGGLTVSPHAVLDDGQLDVVIVLDGTPVEIASLTAEYVISDYLEHELAVFRRAQRIELHSDPPMPFTADGDVIGDSPLTLNVLPRRLRVLVPA